MAHQGVFVESYMVT